MIRELKKYIKTEFKKDEESLYGISTKGNISVCRITDLNDSCKIYNYYAINKEERQMEQINSHDFLSTLPIYLELTSYISEGDIIFYNDKLQYVIEIELVDGSTDEINYLQTLVLDDDTFQSISPYLNHKNEKEFFKVINMFEDIEGDKESQFMMELFRSKQITLNEFNDFFRNKMFRNDKKNSSINKSINKLAGITKDMQESLLRMEEKIDLVEDYCIDRYTLEKEENKSANLNIIIPPIKEK